MGVLVRWKSIPLEAQYPIVRRLPRVGSCHHMIVLGWLSKEFPCWGPSKWLTMLARPSYLLIFRLIVSVPWRWKACKGG